ncbi:hypothetical protein VSR73_35225 [Paraburkholderia ferrariae]|uniref:Uncharacterized protein n=1 Tax=Paraburkholderia ferrariae TaxID=386056 RepID=A0ABU9S364_9BURK
MSEYQYYEFACVDQLLTATQQAELRSFSTRATITASSFVNEYHWGNLKGDPLEWVQQYIDAHVYSSNWGSCRLLLRLPHGTFGSPPQPRPARHYWPQNPVGAKTVALIPGYVSCRLRKCGRNCACCYRGAAVKRSERFETLFSNGRTVGMQSN